MYITKILTRKLNGLCFYFKKITFKLCNKFKSLKSFKITLYLLQNEIHELCKLLSKIELIIFFPVRIHEFRVKNFNTFKNEILKKQAKNTKFSCVKN